MRLVACGAKACWERYSPKIEVASFAFHIAAGSSLISSQIDTNVCRVTLQCSRRFGRAQSIHELARQKHWAYRRKKLPNWRCGLQQVNAYESGVTQAVDPFGGSDYVEAKTDELEKAALQLIEEIEERGGVIPCIEEGWQQNLIQQSAYEYQLEIENETRIIVGQNKFQENTSGQDPVFSIDDKVERDQVARLKAFRDKRNAGKASEMRGKLHQAAQEGSNLVPHIYNCVVAQVTLGEIVESLTSVYGRFRGQ
ncbi:MAG: hypothetical protein H6617_03715 [Bdellovibrionaceae bacterium]|nr:hypothetical protein [Pseudobdellovibrionaceae bacterium]